MFNVQAVVAHGSSVGDRNKKEGSKKGPPALAGTREYKQSRLESLAGRR